jgi:hypothetical protein
LRKPPIFRRKFFAENWQNSPKIVNIDPPPNILEFILFKNFQQEDPALAEDGYWKEIKAIIGGVLGFW